ncbi:hypothetical protein BT96DRAFT_98305 [Gymnopus androsaceus JB14]|uniref:Uncharacterized protein n=1 Tax=Gymnopus androsaceus JB14 TaxID=1447944 RepID=A0A6A4HFS8_9AGAR|nr:hypothetical protein BT96DRAFT_98305 [Gymnopus androsaceus JB14]
MGMLPFLFDRCKPVKQCRVFTVLRACVGEKNMMLDRFFTVAMSNFIADGFDRYTCFTESDVETSMTLVSIPLNQFRDLRRPTQGMGLRHIARSKKAVFIDRGGTCTRN